MTQATGQMSMANAKIEYSTNGSSWTDMSGFANEIGPDGGDVQSGEAYTFSGNTALLAKGKMEPREIKIKVIYTEGGGDPYAAWESAYRNLSAMYVRWSPKGGSSGNKMFTSGEGIVTQFDYPAGKPEGGDVTLFGATLKVADITPSTVA